MKPIGTKNLTESLTLLSLIRQEDGEGGWMETWKRGPTLWVALWPLVTNQDKAHYRLVMRAGIPLPHKFGFLWSLRYATKRLVVLNKPTLIQNNQFLCMTVEEDSHG